MRNNPIDVLLFLLLKIVKFFDGRQTDLKYFDPEAVKNILVVSSTAIGDTLLSTPAIKICPREIPSGKDSCSF